MPNNHPPYLTITHGLRGYFVVLLCWNKEGFYEPWGTGFGSYATPEEACPEAEAWAAAEDIEFRNPTANPDA